VPGAHDLASVSHPAHIQDAAAAFAWVKRHIADYGGNPDQVFVIGHSAGAYLAVLLALDRTDRRPVHHDLVEDGHRRDAAAARIVQFVRRTLGPRTSY